MYQFAANCVPANNRTAAGCRSDKASQAITVVMLFLAGFALARYAGHESPMRPAMAMAVWGGVLAAIVKELGG